MEDCVAEAPRAFLPEVATLLSRQETIGGFRPDLLFRDKAGRVCIVELQLWALDRVHLYKCLEYRDLIHERDGGDLPRVILLCEEFHERYKRILATHSVEAVVIPRKKFIPLAVKHCPNSLEKHLLLDDPHRSEPDQHPHLAVVQIERYGWSGYRDRLRVFEHICRQFAKAGIDQYSLPLPYQNEVYNSLHHYLEYDTVARHSELHDFRYWNLKRLFQPWGDRPLEQYILECDPHHRDFHKPRIALIPHVTSKGNLSVLWEPEGRGSTAAGDFKYWSQGHYGYERPANELMYVRSVDHLNLRLHDDPRWRQPEHVEVIDELLVCLMRAIFDSLKESLTTHCDVRLINDFEFDFEGLESEKSERWDTPARRIMTWRIYNLEERQRKEEERWRTDFEAQYGLTLLDFISAWREEAEAPRRSPENAAKYLPRRFEKAGKVISSKDCKAITERLLLHHGWMLPEPLSVLRLAKRGQHVR